MHSQRRRGVSEEVPIPRIIESRLPINPPVMKDSENNRLQKQLTGVHPLLQGWRDLWRSVKLGAIRSPLLIGKLPSPSSSLWWEIMLRTSEQISTSGAKWTMLWRPVRPIWLAFLKTPTYVLPMPTCNTYAKRILASTGKTCLRVHYEEKHFINFFPFFSLLLVGLDVRHFCQRVKRYLST